MKIVYTFRAKRDLQEIYEYIFCSLRAAKAAKTISETIMREIKSLEIFPNRNPLYHEEPWHSQGVRFTVAKNYLIFYTVNTEKSIVSIARILYGGMDIEHQLEETDEW